jgi:hypothetical protein
MKTLIGIFLILKAISNVIKIFDSKKCKLEPDFLSVLIVELALFLLHLWFGIWLLTDVYMFRHEL